jgi:hypothetical protein
MGPHSVREYATSLQPHYLTASRTKKANLLTEFCRVTGRHRKSAIRLLRRRLRPAPPRPGRPRRYGPGVLALLRSVWQASDSLCGKRLAPFLPTLVKALDRHRMLQVPPPLRPVLLRLSPATIDRLLRPHRRGHPRGIAITGPSHPALAAQVPIRTFGDWRAFRPGSFQADLVAYCGESTEGFYLTSLRRRGCRQRLDGVPGGLGQGGSARRHGCPPDPPTLPHAAARTPHHNGGEFLNHILVPWCRRERIQFTRGRPHRKNDQAYAEQKNWAIVRRLIGYNYPHSSMYKRRTNDEILC